MSHTWLVFHSCGKCRSRALESNLCARKVKNNARVSPQIRVLGFRLNKVCGLTHGHGPWSSSELKSLYWS